MKRLCTKFTAALLVLALTLGCMPAALAVAGVSAKAGNIDLTLNGAPLKLGTYNIANNNYVKLRDVAQLFKGTGMEFSVTWNGPAQRIDLISGQAYQSAGGELSPLAAGYQFALPNTASVWLNGSAVDLTAYTINGNNFFKLRDLGSALNFFVGWDAATGVVSVDTSKSYVPEPSASSNGDQSAMAKAMLEQLDADNASNAYLLDMDFDGVLELMTYGFGYDGYTSGDMMSLYDWKNGELQTVWSFVLAGSGDFAWYLCKNTITGEQGIERYYGPSGDHTGGSSTFYYPTRELSVVNGTYYDSSNDVEVEEYRINENTATKAEWQAALDQNQRVQLLMDWRGSEVNIAAVRAYLNGML